MEIAEQQSQETLANTTWTLRYAQYYVNSISPSLSPSLPFLQYGRQALEVLLKSIIGSVCPITRSEKYNQEFMSSQFLLFLPNYSHVLLQVMKKISNEKDFYEIKRMQGCLFSNEEICYWPTMYSNKGVTQNGNTIDQLIDHASLHQWLAGWLAAVLACRLLTQKTTYSQ